MAFYCSTVSVYNFSFTMLKPVAPLSFVPRAVRIRVNTEAFFDIVPIIALVTTPVRPLIKPITTKNTVLEFTAIWPAVVPCKDAEAAHLVVEPVAFETWPVRPPVDPVSLLNVVFKVALIITALCPDFNAKIHLFGLLRVGRIGLLSFGRSRLNAPENTHLRGLVKHPDAWVIFSRGCSEEGKPVPLAFYPIPLEVTFVGPHQLSVTAKNIVINPWNRRLGRSSMLVKPHLRLLRKSTSRASRLDLRNLPNVVKWAELHSAE